MTCKICGLQYVGSTTTKFRLRFNNYKSRIRHHGRLEEVNREDDDLLYKHLWSEGHNGLVDVKIQMIDGEWKVRIKGEEGTVGK